MKRFQVIATANRGRLDPPEPLDEDGQRLANAQLELEIAQQQPRARRRAGYLIERDPPVRQSEMTPKPPAREGSQIWKRRTA